MSFRSRLTFAVLVLAGCCAWAQEPPAQDGPIHTLRVFTNLIQIPTLVLDERARPVEESTRPKFMVSLDAAKPFAASHARLEGEDAISLTVLLDASGGQNELLREMAYAFSSLGPATGKPAKPGAAGLRAHDHVSLYAVDCAVVRTLVDAPAERATLKAGLQELLKATALHGDRKHGNCEAKLLLRNTLMKLTLELALLPGRRVILAVTAGGDGGSDSTWLQVSEAQQRTGVTMFGLATPARGSSSIAAGSGRLSFSMVSAVPGFEPAFQLACELSGGIVLTASERNLKQQMNDFTALLRARYIVQFPRSEDATSGTHVLAVAVAGKQYFIRAAGASVPLADPRLKSDPTVLHGTVGEKQ